MPIRVSSCTVILFCYPVCFPSVAIPLSILQTVSKRIVYHCTIHTDPFFCALRLEDCLRSYLEKVLGSVAAQISNAFFL